MAQVATQPAGQDPNAVQLGKLIDTIYETIPYIDVGAEEEDAKITLDPGLLSRDTSLETLLLVTWLAERERVKRLKLDPKDFASMVGKVHSKRLLRQILWMHNHQGTDIVGY